MADKEIKIKVSTETDISNLEELDNLIDVIQEKSGIQVDIDSSGIDDAAEKTEELNEDLDETDSKTASPEVDESSIDEADEKTKELNDDLDETDGKSVSPDVDSSGMDDLKEKTDEASSSMDSLTTAVAGIGVTAGIEQMVSTADRINTSWNQLELTFGAVTEDMKSKISGLTDTTGRSGGLIRGYFNQMGIAGVTNTDLLSSSFEALSGKAYQTGNSIEMMESKMQTMVLTGNASSKMLKSLGLDAEDLAQVMGVSADQVSEAFKNMTPEERLQAITQAMGDGAKANDMYKNSYEGLKTQAETAMAGLMGAVGQAILPIVIPALKVATNFVKLLTDGFKMLPGPVQAVIGGVLGFAGIALTVVGVLGTLGQVVKGVKGGLEALNLITKLSAVYNKAAAAAQWLLNVAMSANPVGILIIAIAALIAILAYLYFTNEDVRNAINGLGQTIMNVLGPAIEFVTNVFNQFTESLGLSTDSWIDKILGFILFIPMLPATLALALGDALAQFLGFTGGLEEMVNTTLNNLWTYITTLGGLIPQSVSITGNQVIDSVLKVMAFMATLPLQLAVIFTNILAKALGFGNNFVQNMLNAGSRAVSNFINQIKRGPSQLAAELQSMINQALSFSGQIGSILWQAGVNAVMGFINGLQRHSPGKMQREFVAEITEMGERVPEESKLMIDNVYQAGKNVTDAFNPSLNDIDFGNVEGVNGRSSAGVGGDLIVNIYGDVDTEERAKFIIETFRKEIAWDNTTAGRTN